MYVVEDFFKNREEEQKKGLMNEETDASETGRRLSYNESVGM